MKVLITGLNGYIANNLDRHLTGAKKQGDGMFSVTRVSVGYGVPLPDLTDYDAIVHTSALVHNNGARANDEMMRTVNARLTYELAQKARACGVGHFIFLSSMSVYESYAGLNHSNEINEKTEVLFTSAYAASKYEAENLLSLVGNDVIISIIRPPMVYGLSCPGNFARLAALAKKLPVFPLVENKRSMIHIDNLCELIRLILIKKAKGLFCPQNALHINTSRLVEDLGLLQGKTVKLVNVPDVLVKASFKAAPVKKMLGTLAYSYTFSSCFDNQYQVTGYQESLIKSLPCSSFH